MTYFLDAATHLYKRVRPFVYPSVQCYFWTTKNVIFNLPFTTKFDEDLEKVKDYQKMTSKPKKRVASNDDIIKVAMSDDE